MGVPRREWADQGGEMGVGRWGGEKVVRRWPTPISPLLTPISLPSSAHYHLGTPISIHIRKYIHILLIYIHIHKYIYIHVNCMYMYLHIYEYIYTYIVYVNIYICTCVYIYSLIFTYLSFIYSVKLVEITKML